MSRSLEGKFTYAIVSFPDDGNSVESIPISWLLPGGTRCLWPPGCTSQEIMNAIRHSEKPQKGWEIHPVEVQKLCLTYKKSLKKLQRAQRGCSLDTTDCEETRSGPSQKRVRKAGTACANEAATTACHTPIARRNPLVELQLMTSSGHPTSNGQPSLCQQSSGGCADFCQHTSDKSITSASGPPVGDSTSDTQLPLGSSSDSSDTDYLPDDPSTAAQFAEPSDDTMETLEDNLKDLSSFNRVVLKTLLDIRHCVRQLGTALDGVRAQQAELTLRLSKNENAAGEPTAILPLFPLKDMRDFEDFETALGSNGDMRAQVQTFLVSLGGKDLREVTRIMLGTLMKKAVQLNFCMQGRSKSKAPFKGTALYDVVFAALRQRTHQDGQDIDRAIGRYFIGAGDRENGRAERQKRVSP